MRGKHNKRTTKKMTQVTWSLDNLIRRMESRIKNRRDLERTRDGSLAESGSDSQYYSMLDSKAPLSDSAQTAISVQSSSPKAIRRILIL